MIKMIDLLWKILEHSFYGDHNSIRSNFCYLLQNHRSRISLFL